MATETTLTPTLLWAQRTNQLFVTIQLSDCKETVLDLTPKSINFSGTSDKKSYHLKLDLFGEIDVDVLSL